VAEQLATAGWFRLFLQHPDQDSLNGFDLEVGTLDGRLARTVSTRFGPLTPSATYRGALPVAAGPFGDVVLYAFWNGTGSELHSISVTTGEDVVVARRDDIIHAVTLDVRTDMIYFVALDPTTRTGKGILRMKRAEPGPAEPFLQADPGERPHLNEEVWKRLWITPDGTRLVLVDCSPGCEATVLKIGDGTTVGTFSIAAGRDVVGLTDGALVTIFGCDPPCAATRYDLKTGETRAIGTFCEAGAIVAVGGAASLVSDKPIAGDCHAIAYRVGGTDVESGIEAPILARPDRERALVPLDHTQGASPPAGWFVLGPASQLVGYGAQQQTAPLLVRASDGAVIQLPLLGPPRTRP
jgi:hypothetical protein